VGLHAESKLVRLHRAVSHSPDASDPKEHPSRSMDSEGRAMDRLSITEVAGQ
jgi:hypothetical protein